MADIFREIDEELRQERAEKLWKRYGGYVIAAAVLIVVAVAGYNFWREYEAGRRAELGARYAAASELLAEGKTGDAAASFAALAGETDEGYGVLARFQQAALRARAGDAAGAVKLYDALAADGTVDPVLRGLADVLAGLHMLETPSPDLDAVARRVSAQAEGTGPWRFSAREVQGLVALAKGDDAAARQSFEKIADDPDAPQGLRQRAAQMLAVIAS